MYLAVCGALTLLVVLLDYITKRIVSGNMVLYQSIPVIKGVFNITYVKNTRRVVRDDGRARWFFVAVTVILIAAGHLLCGEEQDHR